MCKPMGYPISLGVSVKPESRRLFQIYLQLLPTNTSHWGNGLLPPLLIYLPGASPHFPSFPQTSLQVPVQAKQKVNLFLSHISWCQAISAFQYTSKESCHQSHCSKRSLWQGKTHSYSVPPCLGLRVGWYSLCTLHTIQRHPVYVYSPKFKFLSHSFQF